MTKPRIVYSGTKPIRITYFGNGLYQLWFMCEPQAISPFGKLWGFVWRLQSDDFRIWYRDTIAVDHHKALCRKHPN